MLVETDVLRSTAPICSAIDMKRLPRISSRTGSPVDDRRRVGRVGFFARLQVEDAIAVDLELEARIEHHRGTRLEDQRGSRQAMARQRAPRASRPLPRRSPSPRTRGARSAAASGSRLADAAADRLSRDSQRARSARPRRAADRLDLDFAARADIAEALAVEAFEGAAPEGRIPRIGRGVGRAPESAMGASEGTATSIAVSVPK